VPQFEPSWQLSVTTATVLAAIALACRGGRRLLPATARVLGPVGAFAREFTIVMSLLALWQRVGKLVLADVGGAMRRALEIDRWERLIHLPGELDMQQWVLPHPWLVRSLNAYYDFVHLNGMALFLVWIWWRHREIYPRVRYTVISSTLACLLVQSVPVAPPRLLSELGYVDTALLYHQSVYGTFGPGLSNQLAAMPSVHVGWAAIVCWYLWWSAGRRWRWIGPVHLATTLFVVMVTANHWWLDGLVAAGFVALAVLGQQVLADLRARSGGTAPAGAGPVPAEALGRVAAD
jgi:PAP2 superfamily